LMLTTTAYFMVDTSDWFVSNRGEIVCILYSVCVLISFSLSCSQFTTRFIYVLSFGKSW
jgi:hypothetical protein